MKLQLGDKIAFYDKDGRHVGIIVAEPTKAGNLLVDSKKESKTYWVHLKQARKLSKKQQGRRVWIEQFPGGNLYSGWTTIKPDCPNYIEFVEVHAANTKKKDGTA